MYQFVSFSSCLFSCKYDYVFASHFKFSESQWSLFYLELFSKNKSIKSLYTLTTSLQSIAKNCLLPNCLYCPCRVCSHEVKQRTSNTQPRKDLTRYFFHFFEWKTNAFYRGVIWTSMVELFSQLTLRLKTANRFSKCSIIYICKSPKYALVRNAWFYQIRWLRINDNAIFSLRTRSGFFTFFSFVLFR